MGVLGQFQGGPIQFDTNTGAIEARGQVDQFPSATSAPASPDPGTRMPKQTEPQPTDGGDVRMPKQTEPQPMDGSPMDAGVSYDSGALGGDFGEDDDSSSMTSNSGGIGGQPFGAIGAKPFGSIGGQLTNNVGSQPFSRGFATNGSVSFDDGGEVEGEAESNPMSVIKSALAFGRKQAGLPLNFSNGTAQQEDETLSFDDGGVIPEPGQQDENEGSGNGTMPADPHKAIAYLAGEGAVSPEIANALEQHVDPQGQMDTSSRVMASLNAAPDPESKFGMLQHYRTQFNGYSAGARAALDQGNIGLAAKHATEAFDRVPTGKKIIFAPAGGGKIAVMVKNALDGMRQFGGAGLLGKAPMKAGDEAWQKFHGDGEGVLSMDEGGEVEEPEEALPVEQEPVQEEPVQEEAHPTILDPEQIKSLLGAGYDKPLDDGWEGLLNTIMGALGPSSAQAAPLGKANAPGLPSNPLGATTPKDRAQGSFASPEPPAAPAPKTNIDESNDRFSNHQKRVEALADKLFPWASQQEQRSAYVANAMSKVTESEGRVDQQHAKSQGDQKLTNEVFKQSQITARSDATRQAKWDTEMAKIDAKAQQGRLAELGKMIRTEMLNHPNASAQDMAAKFGAPVAVVNQLVTGAKAAPATGAAPEGGPAASSSGPREGDTRPYTVGGVTKQYKFQNGQWRRQN